jgi:hypothetical protein
MLEDLWCSVKTFAHEILDGTALTNFINYFIATRVSGSNLLVTELSPKEVREKIARYTDLKINEYHSHFTSQSIFAYIRKHYKGVAINENEFDIKVNPYLDELVYRLKIKLIPKDDGTLVLLYFPAATRHLLLIFFPLFIIYLFILFSSFELHSLIHFFAWVSLAVVLFMDWAERDNKKIGTNFWRTVLGARQVNISNLIRFSSSK